MAHVSTDTATATPLRVLVADDSEALRKRVRAELEEAGLAVVGEAADGAQALTQAAAHHPDVVLMDLCMPRMDGIQATRTLRLQQPDTHVVLWTGDDNAQLDRAIRKSGAQVGIPKGIRTVELVATLRAVCDAQDETHTLVGGRDDQADSRPGRPGGRHSARRRTLWGLQRTPATWRRPRGPLTLQPHRRAQPPAEGLAPPERAALEQLGTADGYTTRWPVGREITRSLANRQLVVVASDYVLLTEAGRRALASDSERRKGPAPSNRAGQTAAPRHDSP
jgi:CheY-like chemotaxis protein